MHDGIIALYKQPFISNIRFKALRSYGYAGIG
jgi:hypothetical protein